MEKTKYYSEIKRYIASRIKSPDDAEDVTQHVFLEFYQNNNRGDNLQNPKAYLFGIARKLIGRYYNQRNKESGLQQIDTKVIDNLSYNNYRKDSKARELIEDINNIIPELPPKAREAVELRLIEDLSPNEAAQKIGCSVDRFYDRFHEGVKILRKKFKLNHFNQKELCKYVQKFQIFNPRFCHFFTTTYMEATFFLPSEY